MIRSSIINRRIKLKTYKSVCIFQELREILERLHALRQAVKDEQLKYYHIPSHLMSLPALHRHRDANVDRDERRWLSFEGSFMALHQKK